MLASEMWSSPGVKGAGAALGQGLFLGTPDLRFLKFDANPSTVTGAEKNGSWNRRRTCCGHGKHTGWAASLCLESLLGPNLVQKAVRIRVCANHSHRIY